MTDRLAPGLKSLKFYAKIVNDACFLFGNGMDAGAFLRFIASGDCDLMAWARLNEPDAWKAATGEQP